MPLPPSSDKGRFWETTPLNAMTKSQWESLCDGCGKCCLHKLEDADSGAVYYTNVACRLLDLETVQCRRYADRLRWVPDCTILKPELIDQFSWLPESCAYRLLAEDRPLPDWHPLLTHDSQSVHKVGMSIRGIAVDERTAGPFEDHIIDAKIIDSGTQ